MPRDKTADILRYTVFPSFLGDLLALVSERGLVALRLVEGTGVTRVVAELAQEHPRSELHRDDAALASFVSRIQAVLNGEMPAAQLDLDLRGTPFQVRVWKALVRVPWGKTCSYSELAARAGNPRAVRAAASACARNPITFVVPCHRILRKGGGLGGYYWGLSVKERLLARERSGAPQAV